jgi:hypothetical protein
MHNRAKYAQICYEGAISEMREVGNAINVEWE